MRSIGDADLRFRVGHGVELSVSWLIKAASVLLMSHAKLFHHVFSIAEMVLEYLQTTL
jgi:hypothetical protein